MHGQCTYRAGGDLECREGFLDVLTPQYNTDAQAQFQCPIQCRDKGGVMNGNWTNAPNLPANSVCGCTLMNRMDTSIPAGNDLSIIPRTRWEDCKLSEQQLPRRDVERRHVLAQDRDQCRVR